MGTKKRKVTKRPVVSAVESQPAIIEPRTSIKTSARLRHTLEVARLAGFAYQENKKNQWGGFFNIYQLEILETKLRELETFKREAALVKKAER